MSLKGDTERQAVLRDRMIKKGKRPKRSIYVTKILSVLKPEAKLLDVGCGTAHIIRELATYFKNVTFVGLDVSSAMLKIAHQNTVELPNIKLVKADGLKLPFSESAFDIVITRLAEYSPKEAYRVTVEGGHFFEYGLGPKANKEILEFFPRRIETENFFFPRTLKEWKQEVSKNVRNAGFMVNSVEDYMEKDYYSNEEELMNLIEMVPLVKNFDREKDRKRICELAEKYRMERGIQITWHYFILKARK